MIRARMRKVYLDNNILVDIENGVYRMEGFLINPHVLYYYSDAHLNELLEAKGIQKVSQEGRLELISRLCGKNYICSGAVTTPEFVEKDCREMYKVADNPFRSLVNRVVVKGVDPLGQIRESLGFESKDFNNEKPENVLCVIDERVKDRLGIGLLEYLYRTEAIGRALYGTLMNMVDMANYWGDVKTDHSEVARLCDASHAYSAQICDVLVTNDKRMRAKVKAVYHFLGVRTEVISGKEYLAQLSRNA